MSCSDGTSQVSKYNELSSVFTVYAEDVPNLTIEKIMGMLDNVAEDMARQVSQNIYQTLNENLQKVDGKDLPFQEVFLASLEALQIEFDQKGNTRDLTLLLHPSSLTNKVCRVDKKVASFP